MCVVAPGARTHVCARRWALDITHMCVRVYTHTRTERCDAARAGTHSGWWTGPDKGWLSHAENLAGPELAKYTDHLRFDPDHADDHPLGVVGDQHQALGALERPPGIQHLHRRTHQQQQHEQQQQRGLDLQVFHRRLRIGRQTRRRWRRGRAGRVHGSQ